MVIAHRSDDVQIATLAAVVGDDPVAPVGGKTRLQSGRAQRTKSVSRTAVFLTRDFTV